MKIGIIGCGWLGIKIAEYLKKGNDVFVTTTSQNKIAELAANGLNPSLIRFSEDEPENESSYWEAVSGLDVLIITVPFSKKGNTGQSNIKFSNLCRFIGGFEKQMFLMSSIGIYPQCELEVAETTIQQESLNENIHYVEELVRQKYPQVNVLRLGGLMGDDRFLSKYKISEPYQIVNHIHYDDICAIIGAMIRQNSTGKTYNVVAPMHPTKNEIVCFQTGTASNEPAEKPFGRKVISDKLLHELKYDFIRPNPAEFPWR